MPENTPIDRRSFIIGSSALGTALGSGIFHSASAQTGSSRINLQSTQELVDETAKKLGVVGGQLAIYDGREIHQFTTGFANREARLPVLPDTLFQIGSTTKVFNAATVMSLVDDGILDLDEPVRNYIRDLRLPQRAERKITLRHLLSMSSGLDNGPYTDYGRGDDALPRYVEGMGEIPRVFEPGEAFGYSNASTNISGLAVARAAGTNWETQLSQRILEPLNLQNSAYFTEDILLRSFAKGYEYPDTSSEAVALDHWALPRSLSPAGGTLCCSAGDLVRLGRMWLDRGVSKSGNRVLSASSVAAVQAPEVKLPTTEMGVHWCVGPFHKVWDGVDIYGHSGTNTGGSSYLLWVPERNFAIATLSNVAAMGYPFAAEIFGVVFKEMLQIQKPKPLSPETVTRVEVDLDRYTGKFAAHDRLMTFTQNGGQLYARFDSSDPATGTIETLRSEMIPLGNDRFLPAELALSGNRNWDVAFWGSDKNGAATNFLNGVFPMYRVE